MSAKEDAGFGTGVFVCVYLSVKSLSESIIVEFRAAAGDTKTEAEGVAEKVASKAKEVAEDAKEAVEGAIKGVKNIFHKEDK